MHGIAIVGFFIGGVLGFFAFEKFEHAALLVNIALTVFCAMVHTAYVSYHERIPVIAVLESSHDIRIHKHRRLVSDPPQRSHSHLAFRAPRARAATLSPRSPMSSPAPAKLCVRIASDPGFVRSSSSLRLSQDKGSPLLRTEAAPHTEAGKKGGAHIRRGMLLPPAHRKNRQLPRPQGGRERSQHKDDEPQELVQPPLSLPPPPPSPPVYTERQQEEEEEKGHSQQQCQDIALEITHAGSAVEDEGIDTAQAEDDDDDCEATPEEDPLPLYDPDDIAALQEQEEQEGGDEEVMEIELDIEARREGPDLLLAPGQELSHSGSGGS